MGFHARDCNCQTVCSDTKAITTQQHIASVDRTCFEWADSVKREQLRLIRLAQQVPLGRALVLGAEQSTSLQLGHDEIDKLLDGTRAVDR
jgi:hypothetical protein